MNHLTEEQLILHYYGESDDNAGAVDTLATEQHLEECRECRGVYNSLQRVLNVVDGLPVPEQSAEYGAQVWQRIEHKLGARRRFWKTFPAAPSSATELRAFRSARRLCGRSTSWPAQGTGTARASIRSGMTTTGCPTRHASRIAPTAA